MGFFNTKEPADTPLPEEIQSDATGETKGDNPLSQKEREKEEKSKKKLESTIRKRKMTHKTITERFLPFAEIRNDTVVLKNGGLRAVLEVQPINYDLKSETEQKGIISGYMSFLNTLNFPIQILVRSSNVNIDPYLEKVRDNAKNQKAELLREQTIAYADFVERIVEVADIMQKRFYIVVPLDDQPEKKPVLAQFFQWMGVDDTITKALNRSRKFHGMSARLRDQINIVESGLHNVGLMTRRLNTQQLIELYYQIYNPKTSQQQKLPANGDYNTENLVL